MGFYWLINFFCSVPESWSEYLYPFLMTFSISPLYGIFKFCLITWEHASISWISWIRLFSEDICKTFFQKSRRAFDHMVSFLSQIFYFFFVLTVLKLKCAAAARLCSRSVNAKGSPVSCLTRSVVAHIVRLVLPHSKRLLLSRGYLIVRGRWCFQESFFRPIKVAVNLGTSCRSLPFSSVSFSHSASHCAVYHTNTLMSSLLRCWSVLFVLFD